MSDVTALFWDVGGVILSNGWDEHARAEAAKRFALNSADYEERHRRAEDELETGGITLETYLDQTIFYRERPFTREEFQQFMFAQSTRKKRYPRPPRRVDRLAPLFHGHPQ